MRLHDTCVSRVYARHVYAGEGLHSEVGREREGSAVSRRARGEGLHSELRRERDGIGTHSIVQLLLHPNSEV